MEGKKEPYFDNNYNLYEYFRKVTLNDREILNKPAIFYGARRINFDQLDHWVLKLSNALAAQLKHTVELGKPGTVIGVHLTPDEYTIPVLMALHRLSLTYLPIDPCMPVKRIQYIVENASLAAVVTNLNWTPGLTMNKNLKVLKLAELLNGCTADFVLFSSSCYDSSQNACVLYTSGSTGSPKGVCISHQSIMNRLNWQWNEYPLDGDDVGLFKTSLNFGDHIAEIFAFVLKGRPVVVCHPDALVNLDKLFEIIEEYCVSYFVLVPSLLKAILLYAESNASIERLYGIKRWVCSGEQLNLDLALRFFHLLGESKCVLSNFYGSTEITADLTYVTFKSKEHLLSLVHNNTLPIGVPISNSGVFILDENLRAVAEGQVGELFAHGTCLANGYLNDAQLNQKFFTLNGSKVRVFRTGDYGYIHKSLIYYAGRHDSQIKLNGRRIDLNEIEFHALDKIDHLEAFIPLVVELNDSQKTIVAFYKSKLDLSQRRLNELIEASLRSFLFDYMVPKYLIKLNDNVPLLYSGKVDKQALLERFNKMLAKNEPDDSNKTQKLFDFILEKTGISKSLIQTKGLTSMNDLNFQQLGIESLNCVDVYLKLKQEFKKEFNLSLEEYISCKSLQELLKKMNTNGKGHQQQHQHQQQTNHNTEFDYVTFPFAENPKYWHQALEMLSCTYASKSPLYKDLFTADSFYESHYDLMEQARDSALSFIVFDRKKGKYVGGATLYDSNEAVSYYSESKMNSLLDKNKQYSAFTFLHKMYNQVEKPVINKLINQMGKRVMFTDFVTIYEDCSSDESAILLNFIETEIINTAVRNNYDAIIATNIIKLTLDICTSKGYVVETELKVNQIEIDGKRQYAHLDDDFKIYVCVKYLK